ncbi:AraC family transcriptional regulator [Agriterribacter sp.]|mgnify:FL=1|uniref:AraC family transcriptional regulator n=1 Tax=Agriterribacter sp. TaxID=2821509 RepID=UPI002CE2394F|nr:AraC family transcriptional regulator [Agriterribacter sp.]HRO47875.1 AraC family transcriptional regulator [Agriterribacter sp.]HRQ18829.1 AraC family transcriptional regulator [Agriterribacter sp.]
MKFALQKSPIPESRIFVAKELKEKHFDATWHAHSEYQLFMVLKGTGTRFIGNTVQSFNEGDLTFLGPGVPHLWRSDSAYFDKRSKLLTHGLVIYFPGDFIGDLIEKEEMQQVKDLFKKARRGIEYYGQTVSRLGTMMSNIIAAHGAASIIQLLQMLEIMAQTKAYRLLHNADYIYRLKESETRRINVVYNYAAQHFRGRIALQEVADLLNMTPTSFSRYFRMKTSKSFSDFITELRIRHACKLLSEEDGKTISQVSYECGFNTLSNFNRQFRLYIKMTPKRYREQFSIL